MQTRRIPKILTEEDYLKVIKVIDEGTSHYNSPIGEFIRWRDKTAIGLMFFCGLRPAEALMLRWEDIDFERSLLYIKPYQNKVRNDTPAILTNPAKELLLLYKEMLKSFLVSSNYLFPSHWTAEPIQSHSFAKQFLNYCKIAGIAKVEYYTCSGKPCYNFRPYSCRHTFCSNVYNKTHSEEAVAKLARHTKIESSHVYIHLNNDEKKRIADFVFN